MKFCDRCLPFQSGHDIPTHPVSETAQRHKRWVIKEPSDAATIEPLEVDPHIILCFRGEPGRLVLVTSFR